MMELVSVIIVALVVQQAVEAIKKAIKIKKGYSLFKLINVKVLLSIAISQYVLIVGSAVQQNSHELNQNGHNYYSLNSILPSPGALL